MEPARPSDPIQHLLSRLDRPKPTGSGYIAKCPAHEDREASLSINEGAGGKVLLKCFAGCSVTDIVSALGLRMSDLFPERGKGHAAARKTLATLQQPTKPADTQESKHCTGENNGGEQRNGITVAEYAEAKKLPVAFLRAIGLSDFSYLGSPAIRIPYRNRDGTVGATRFRKALQKGKDGDERFKWKSGSKTLLYGLERKYNENYAIIVEGESDCHTLWYHGFPAYGVPGASNWKEDRDAQFFDGCDTIYVIKEPDDGGETLIASIRKSAIISRVKVIALNGHKDPSELYLNDPANFKQNLHLAMSTAIPLSDIEKAEAEAHKAELWDRCETLAHQPSILDIFISAIRSMGVAGEERILRLLYLALTSRHLPRPISIVLKGPSSGGKSFLVETVLSFYPGSAYYALTSMSEHALAYSEESLRHRMLVIYEAAGLSSDLASYLIRSRLSEGRIRYETIVKGKDGLESKLIDREGPTGCILTTTAASLHPENETRLLSLTVSDTQEQTREILHVLAGDTTLDRPDLSQWHDFQEWLDYADHAVAIPFAETLADHIPPIAVRLRRDFTMILNLIKAHAILQQATRERDENNRIIATVADYRAIRELIADPVSDCVGATVSPGTRETVQAVQTILSEGNTYATLQQCATALNLDKSAAWRRVNVCVNKGYLVNTQDKRRKPMQLVIGEPLPEELEILPSPDRLGCCAVASESGRVDIPPPPPISINDPGFIDEDDPPDVQGELWNF